MLLFLGHWHRSNFCNATAYAGRLDTNVTSPVLRNPAISMSFLVKILKTAIDTSEALHVDADRRAGWADIVAHIAPFPVATIPTSRTDSAPITVFTAQEHPLYFPGSTNPLAFYAMWPGENVGLGSTPAAIAIARQTVLSLGALGAWSQGNAFPETFPAAVRAGVDPHIVLSNMTDVITRTMPRNILGKAEGQECAGATQAVNDMLCSSYGGVLRLFAVWDRAQHDAAFTTLRAKGGLLVSGDVRAGVVGPVTIVAEQAGGTVTMLSPWASGKVSVVEAGTGNRVPTTPGKGGEAGTWSWTVGVEGTAYTVTAG